MIKITEELPQHAAAIERLLNGAFGPRRQRKTSYRFRSGIAAVQSLCLIASETDAIVGTIRYWPVQIGQTPALLLGPLAVAAEYRRLGLGATLMERSLAQAKQAGHTTIVLVGDLAYYARFGFVKAASFGITMADENPERLLVASLEGSIPAPGEIHRLRAAPLPSRIAAA